MAKPAYFGLRRIIRATGFSLAGLRATWANESAFREECVLTVFLLPAAWWLGTSAVERSLLIGAVFLVLIVEVLNSAIESVVDRIGPEQHTLAGRAKDQGSAAVFLALGLFLVTWGLIAWERFA